MPHRAQSGGGDPFRRSPRRLGTAGLVAVLGLSAPIAAASAQTCIRYKDFEGTWDGWVKSEVIERRYPNAMLAVPQTFNPDHRRLNITYRGSYYEVAWNLVRGQNVPSLRESAEVAEDTDGYCGQVRRQSGLSPDVKGLRLNIQGTYDNGGVLVGFWTRTCCFLHRPQEMSCAGATHYRTKARQQERPWYDGVWYASFARPPRPNACGGS